MDLVLGAITDKNDPGFILMLGDEEKSTEMVGNIQRVRPDLDQKHWLAVLPPLQRNGAAIQPSLASEEYTRHIIDVVNKRLNAREAGDDYNFQGHIKLIVLFGHIGKEQHLLHLLESCRNLTVVRVVGDRANGRLEISKFQGWEAVPDRVDLTLSNSAEKVELTEIPVAAMYGKAYEIADQTLAAKGFAYVAVITTASLGLTSTCPNIRSTMYGGELGTVGSGKSVAIDRTKALFGLTEQDNRLLRTPYSDRGLAKICPGTEFKKRMICIDEGRVMMAKGNIENSSLIPLLCSLWSHNVEGGADKHGLEEVNVELSILMNIKVRGPEEFPEVFTHSTAHGFWDRCIFGVLGTEKWDFKEWEFDPAQDVCLPDITQPVVSAAVYEAAREWQAGIVERKRLREIVLRIAYITASLNGDMALTKEALEAAMCFCEWQESIRREYQPAQGADDYQVAYNAIEEAFRKRDWHANWRELSRKNNWNKYHGRVLTKLKSNLESDGTLGYIRDTKEHFWRGGNEE